MSTEFETERKQTINGSAARAALPAVPFDTADRRLARWGITLRRRQGGPDAGWQLTVPSGTDTRWELHRPLRTERPPQELAALLTGVTRGAELVAVAELTNPRVVGQRLAAHRPSAGAAVQEYLHDQVAVLLRQDVLVRAGADDAVHQLRVAARRLRAALREYG